MPEHRFSLTHIFRYEGRIIDSVVFWHILRSVSQMYLRKNKQKKKKIKKYILQALQKPTFFHSLVYYVAIHSFIRDHSSSLKFGRLLFWPGPPWKYFSQPFPTFQVHPSLSCNISLDPSLYVLSALHTQTDRDFVKFHRYKTNFSIKNKK